MGKSKQKTKLTSKKILAARAQVKTRSKKVSKRVQRKKMEEEAWFDEHESKTVKNETSKVNPQTPKTTVAKP